MKSLAENYGHIHETQDVLAEALNQKQIDASIGLVKIIEAIIKPVSAKLPVTMGAIRQAKAILRSEMVDDITNRVKHAITPNMFKPLSQLSSATGFISALAQGLVQASKVFTTLNDIPEDRQNDPLSSVTDNRVNLFKQLKSAITPDGVLGFMRGMPLADENAIARELMELSSNDFKAIVTASEALVKNSGAANRAADGARAGSEDAARARRGGRQRPPDNDPTPSRDPGDSGGSPDDTANEGVDNDNTSKREAFSKKKYADALYMAVRKLVKVTPEQINNFVSNVADLLSKQGIPVRELKTLRGKMGDTLLKENLEYDQLRAAASKAGIANEDDQLVVIFKLAKMMVSDRADQKSGELPRVFPPEFKILKVPTGKANELIGRASEKVNDDVDRGEYKKRDAGEKNFKNPTLVKMELPVVTNPYGIKGHFIPIPVDPVTSGIIVQGREVEQEDETPTDPNDDGTEYANRSKIWYIDVKKLWAATDEYEKSIKPPKAAAPEPKEPDTSSDTKTVVQRKEPAKK